MKCQICGADAQPIDGFKLCDEHKAMAGVVKMAQENKEFLEQFKLPRARWMEED